MSNPVESGRAEVWLDLQSGKAETGIRKLNTGLDETEKHAHKAGHAVGMLDHKLDHLLKHEFKKLTGGLAATAGVAGIIVTGAVLGFEKIFDSYKEHIAELKKSAMEAITEIGKSQETVGKTKGVTPRQVEELKRKVPGLTDANAAKMLGEMNSMQTGKSVDQLAPYISALNGAEPTADGGGLLAGGLAKLNIPADRLVGLIEASGNRGGDLGKYIQDNIRRLSKDPHAAGKLAAIAEGLNSKDMKHASRDAARMSPEELDKLDQSMIGKEVEGGEVARANRSLDAIKEDHAEALADKYDLKRKKALEAGFFNDPEANRISKIFGFGPEQFENATNLLPMSQMRNAVPASAVPIYSPDDEEGSDNQNKLRAVLDRLLSHLEKADSKENRRNEGYTDARTNARPGHGGEASW